MMYFIVALLLICCGIVAVLHFLKRDFAPYNHTISEYAHGRFGWCMVVTFVCMSIANMLLVIEYMNKELMLGILFALVSGCFVVLAICRTDIIISDTKNTRAGFIHNLFGIVMNIAIMGAMFIVQDWVFVGLAFVAFMGFAVSVFAIRKVAVFGVTQRLFYIIVLLWYFYLIISNS